MAKLVSNGILAIMAEPLTCPLEILIRQLSGVWTLQIVWELKNHGPRNYGGLRRAISPISVKMLSDRLRLLAELDLVCRHENADSLGTVTYSLTDQGHQLYALIDPLYKFACEMPALELGAAAIDA